MDLSSIKTFVLTVELGSLAAVGRKLGLSSAAISKQLTKLEEILGLQLLIRTTRHIELTEVGTNYYLQCQRILEEVETASALVSQVKAEPTGVLKIVSARYFAKSYIVPYIQEFLSKYPKIELNLELAERVPDFNSEAIDVVIGMSMSILGDAVQKRIMTTHYTFCASPSYLEQFGIPSNPNDLKNHRYITHTMRTPDDELVFNNQERVTVKPHIRVNDSETMLNFALDGLGIVKLHHYMIKQYLEKGLLKEFLASYTTQLYPIYVAYPQRRYISPKVRCFIDFIIEKIA